ncbi:hypothetical protein [Streptomyces sp. NPDC001507]|uniref:hypothetical protein n=1 Tax=Streptomyces sp. NPDC001507 TaxID=3364579 RepID=UPI0036A34423
MGGSRLVTLSGAGGAGKTRLAQRAVALGRAAGTGTDVAWADLSPLRNAHLLAATVADALGLSDHTPRLPADAGCAWIGDRSTLLVLDSCEHLPAECRDLAGDLLTACPNLRILATSREPLRVRGEAVVEIEPFASAAEAVALIAFLAGRPHDSVRHARAALDAKRHIGDAFGIGHGDGPPRHRPGRRGGGTRGRVRLRRGGPFLGDGRTSAARHTGDGGTARRLRGQGRTPHGTEAVRPDPPPGGRR